MKRTLIIILSIFFFTGCQNQGGKLLEEINKEYKSHNYFNYKVKSIVDDNITKAKTYSIFVNNKTNTFVFINYNRIYKVYNKGITYIDDETEEFSEFKKGSEVYTNFFEALKSQISEFNLYTPYFTSSKKIKTKDTIINSENYKILSFKGDEFIVTESNNSASGRYLTYIYYNEKNKLADKIEYILEDTISNKISERKIKYEFYDFSFEDKSNEIKSIFDYNNAKYSLYTKHDEINVPYSFRHTGAKDTVMTSELLNYPIVDINGDTTTINQQKGWVMLDFWFFGCTSCKDFHESLRLEKEKKGYTFLSKNNIKLMSINPLTTDKDKLMKEVKGFGMEQNTYYSKGINEYLYMEVMPIYYLVSPDKKIIYHSRNLKDYSEIKKIIEEYK